jgi:hypothetical protein
MAASHPPRDRRPVSAPRHEAYAPRNYAPIRLGKGRATLLAATPRLTATPGLTATPRLTAAPATRGPAPPTNDLLDDRH